MSPGKSNGGKPMIIAKLTDVKSVGCMTTSVLERTFQTRYLMTVKHAENMSSHLKHCIPLKRLQYVR